MKSLAVGGRRMGLGACACACACAGGGELASGCACACASLDCDCDWLCEPERACERTWACATGGGRGDVGGEKSEKAPAAVGMERVSVRAARPRRGNCGGGEFGGEKGLDCL